MLALKYRPDRFADLVGQPQVSKVLSRLLELYREGKADMPAGFLFAGPRGTGKTSTARIVAMSLNCGESESFEPCGQCSVCKQIRVGAYSSVLELDAASHGLVEDIRALREKVLYYHPGLYMVVILDEAHSSSREAFNALLKQLEEPPPGVLYILVTTEPEKILTTVQSRLMVFYFRGISIRDIEARLKYVASLEEFGVEDGLFRRIAGYVDGSIRDALMILEKLKITDNLTIAGFEEIVSEINDDLCGDIMKMISVGDYLGLSTLLEDELVGIGVDVVVDGLVRFAARILRVQLGAKGERGVVRELAKLLPSSRVIEFLKVMWDIRRMKRSRSQDRVTLQLAFVLMTERSMKLERQPVAQVSAGEKVLSSGEIEKFLERA